MSTKGETPEEQRERLRQEEIKNNLTGSLNDGYTRGSLPNFNGMGWKETGALILILIVGYVVYKVFF